MMNCKINLNLNFNDEITDDIETPIVANINVVATMASNNIITDAVEAVQLLKLN
jgi:hypothetical protein